MKSIKLENKRMFLKDAIKSNTSWQFCSYLIHLELIILSIVDLFQLACYLSKKCYVI